MIKLSISKGNSKKGKIPGLNLPPGVTCNPEAPCNTCRKGYCWKAWRLYPSCRKAWRGNLALYREDYVMYWAGVNRWIEKNKPGIFRFFDYGDIPDMSYLAGMVDCACRNPETAFLAFTKRFEIISDYGTTPHPDSLGYGIWQRIPDNLSIVLSMWPGMPDPVEQYPGLAGLPKAWVQDGTEDRIPADAIQCAGRCDSCGMCWSLKDVGRDVWFRKH